MTNQEALYVLIDAKYCRNAEHEALVDEAIMTLQHLLDIMRVENSLENLNE